MLSREAGSVCGRQEGKERERESLRPIKERGCPVNRESVRQTNRDIETECKTVRQTDKQGKYETNRPST